MKIKTIGIVVVCVVVASGLIASGIFIGRATKKNPAIDLPQIISAKKPIQKVLKTPKTLDEFKYCANSPIAISVVFKTKSMFEVTAQDSCKMTTQKFEYIQPFKKNVLILSYAHMFATEKGFQMSMGASVAYYRMLAQNFGMGVQLSVWNRGEVAVYPGIIIIF